MKKMKKMRKALCTVALAAGVLFSTLSETAITVKAAETTEILTAYKAADTSETISADKADFGLFINDMLAITQERVEGKRLIDWNYENVKAYGKEKVPNAQDDGDFYSSTDGKYEYSVFSDSTGYKAVELFLINEKIMLEGVILSSEQLSGAAVISNQGALPIATKYTSLSTMGNINGMNPADYFNSMLATGEKNKTISFSDGTKMMVETYGDGEYSISYVSASEKSGVCLVYEDGVLMGVMTVFNSNEAFPTAVSTGGTTPVDTIVVPGQVSMYRLYNPNSGEHFYTGSVGEKDNLVSVGWSYESVAWISPETSNTPVYRLYNPNSGEHHYTTDAGERDGLVAIGWKDEGIGWYAADSQKTPMYRLYNPNAKGAQEAGAHHYTNSAAERDNLVSVGWKDEGIGWYGL